MHWFKGDGWKLREALPDVSLASASFRDGRVDELLYQPSSSSAREM